MVIGGILSIAIADSCSDALVIHVSEESENEHNHKEIWGVTLYTFLSKFLFALTFIIPVLLLSLSSAILVSILWGVAVLGILSYFIAKDTRQSPWKVISEHIGIAVLVIIATHFVGRIISTLF